MTQVQQLLLPVTSKVPFTLAMAAQPRPGTVGCKIVNSFTLSLSVWTETAGESKPTADISSVKPDFISLSHTLTTPTRKY